MKLTTFKQAAKLLAAITLFGVYSVALIVVGIGFEKNAINLSKSKDNSESSEVLMRPQAQEEVQSAEVLASNVKLCANTQVAFEIAYPNEWFTTYNNKEDECTHFAPYSFVLPSVPDENFSPITVRVIPPEEWESTLESQKNPTDIFSVISFKNIEFDTKPVKYIEAISTGSSVQKGFYKISYLIYDSKTPIEIIYFQQTQEEDTASYRQTLEDMAKSIKLY